MRIRLTVLLVSLICAGSAWADRWGSDPERGRMQFQGDTVSGPLRGDFRKYRVNMLFKSDQLEQAYLIANIQTNSVQTAQSANDLTLSGQQWLYTQMFPYVVFESNDISRLADGRYEAKGTLDLGSATGSARLRFTLDPAAEKGTTRLNGIAKIDKLHFEADSNSLLGESVVGSTVRLAVDLFPQPASP